MSSGRMPEERFSYRIVSSVSSTIHNALHLLRHGGGANFLVVEEKGEKEEKKKRKERKKGLESFSRSDTLPVPDRFKIHDLGIVKAIAKYPFPTFSYRLF